MAADNPDRDPLEELAAEFLERQRCGQPPSIDEYASRYPDLADEIRELFPTITALEHLKVRDGLASGGLASLGPVQLRQLGDYRIVREIGRGGMGIVFQAEQESLGRPVAVKVLPPQALLDVRHLARFHREARIAGRLHHTNIVQVFGVGQQEGFHYYVMQFVRGVGLDRLIARLAAPQRGTTLPADAGCHALLPVDEPFSPDRSAPGGGRDSTTTGTAPDALLSGIVARWPAPGSPERLRRVARIGVQAAEALQYAHSRGTLHRDIKPANLLIDENDTVYLTDFGLARALHAENVTQPGDITGTLRYVPPERFAGKVGESGDIYSLGLTLYELLALQPAYADGDRSELIRRITQQEPRPLRKIDPRICRDLETIVHKATAHDPQHRYPTAAALADDLRRFLEDRPVQARRIGPAERLWRWTRRNPAVASLALSSMLLLLAVAIVANVGYVRTRRALQGEARQRLRAEAVSTLAQEALDRIFDRLGPVRALQVSPLSIQGSDNTTVEVPLQPALSRETAALLAEMLPFYDRLAEQAGDDVPLRLRAADANHRLGDIHQRLGQYTQAAAAYHKAIDLYEPQDGHPPITEGAILPLAQVYNELGRLYRTTRQMDEARQSHLQALRILQPGSAEPKDDPSLCYETARTLYFLGARMFDGSEPPPGGPRPDARQGPPPGPRNGPPPEPREGPPPERRDGSPPEPRGDGPDAPPPPGDDRPATPPPGESLLGRIVSAVPLLPPPPRGAPPPDPRRQRAYLDQAVTLLKNLAARSPGHPEYRRMLALCYRDGAAGNPRRDPAAAAQGLSQAIDILEQLARDFPQVSDYRLDLCETYAAVDLRPRPDLDDPQAETRLGKALALAQALTAEYPNVPQYQAVAAQIHHKLGMVYRQTQRLRQAEQSDRQALACQQALIHQVPDVAAYQVVQAAFSHSLADVLMQNGKLDEARDLLQRTIAGLETLRQGQPGMWYLQGLLADLNTTLAQTLRRNGQAGLANQAQARADEHLRQLREHAPPPPNRRPPPPPP
jgi:serine/threonine protein kinase